MMRFLTTALGVFVFIHAVSQELPFQLSGNENNNFFDIQQAAETYFNQHETDEGSDNAYIKYKRWEWYWKSRIMPDGSFPDLIANKRIFDEAKVGVAGSNRDLSSPWTNINQTYGDGGYNGMGRATSVAFHPTDPDIFYVGAPIGGIWKTTDGGETYSALGDSLPYVSVGNICVDHQNPDIIYITIGDHVGWWNYGLGVYKSIDGGQTWEPTGNIADFTNSIAYMRMVMNPYNSQELFVAQTNGLFRTQDGGENWEMVHDGSHHDVIFKPGSDAVLYCATDDYFGSSEVYVSVDHGENWTQSSDFNMTANYLELTVTPAQPEFLGIQSSASGTMDFYASFDSGLTVDYISMMPDDGVIFFSPQYQDVLYCGFVVVYRSVDGGFSWEQFTDWYDSGEFVEVHADNRNVVYHPLTNEIFFCNDGGVYKYDEDMDWWTELTAGLIITQYYRIAVSQNDEIFMIGGTQDNGGRKRVGFTEWEATNGGDAMEVAINHEDDEIIYTTYINGQLYRSYDQWNGDTYHEITPQESQGGAWVTPYVLQPSDPSIIVAGYEDVYRSNNQGNSWTALSSNLTGNVDNKISAIAVATTNDDVIYASYGVRLYYTANSGDTWGSQNVFLGATNGAEISSIVVHPYDASKLWVTISGYAVGKKVFFSDDGGDSFTNVSFNLPNVPINASVIDKESPHLDLYVGTDVGVFIFNEDLAAWEYFGEGLPNTSVTDLEIQYSSRKLRAGTFGRGIWENDLFSEPGVSVITRDEEAGIRFDLAVNPVEDVLVLNVHSSVEKCATAKIYTLNGKLVATMDRNITPGHYQWLFDLSELSSGNYLVHISGEALELEAIQFFKN
ncbi:MAG: hypothetical protein K1X54_03920 [Flavobacteriales bacterium]|nr:hypothetical protein [Flavobacteriales bacterium]